MKDRYLVVTYRDGEPLAAYLHLPRPAGAKSVRCEKAEKGMVVDFDGDGVPIGVEITAPRAVTVEDLNRLFERLGLPGLAAEELAPLVAA